MRANVKNQINQWATIVIKELERQGITYVEGWHGVESKREVKALLKIEKKIRDEKAKWEREQRAWLTLQGRTLSQKVQDSKLHQWKQELVQAREKYKASQESIRTNVAIRLLNLRTWHLRYQVPLSFIISTLLQRYAYIRKHYIQRNEKHKLGVSVKILTSIKSRSFIEEEIERTLLPDHLATVRQRQIDIINGSSNWPKLTEYKDVDIWVRDYQRWKLKQHRQPDVKLSKPYRNNPWRA